MKKVLSVMLVLVMLLAQLALPSFANVGDFGDIVADDEWVDPYEGLEVKSVVAVAQKPLIENVDGWYETDENGNDTYFYYDVDFADVYYTVTYENGEIEEGYYNDLYGDIWRGTAQCDEWKPGKYTAKGSYRGFEFEFEVEVAKTPVASVVAKPQNVLIDGWDSYEYTITDENGDEVKEKYYYVGRANPIFTITMKDGTVYTGDVYEIGEQTDYWVDYGFDQEVEPYKIGKNTVSGNFMGFDFTLEVEIIANPYKSVSLEGENELYLVFEGFDEKDSYKDKITCVSFNDWSEDYSYIDAYIETESGKDYYVTIYCDARDDGFVPNKNIRMVFEGGQETNTLETCNFFVVDYNMYSVLYAATEYYQVSELITGKQFTGYNADGETDVDHIVALATMMYGDYHWDGELAYSDTVENTENNIEYLFGRTDIDVKDSVLYKFSLFGGSVEIADYGYSSYSYSGGELVYGDGKWTATADVYDFETYEYIGLITVVLNEDGTIYSIDLEEIEIQSGDVNCDGAVTAVDARLVLQYVAGLIDEYEFNTFYSDLNDDGVVTAVDARLILQKVAGLIE